MTARPSAATVFAVELLGELIRRGVRDVVVCPGSRSQALALAAAAAERADAIRLHVRVDERSAGFFALGVARETGVPAPVVVTSGTAVANLAPAVLEAHEARVPMLVLTADRPDELRGIRSNQTTRQLGLLGSGLRLALDVPAPADAENGDIVAAMLDGEATVKVFRRRDGHTWLLPRNSAFEPILGDYAEVLGKVVAVFRSV